MRLHTLTASIGAPYAGDGYRRHCRDMGRERTLDRMDIGGGEFERAGVANGTTILVLCCCYHEQYLLFLL